MQNNTILIFKIVNTPTVSLEKRYSTYIFAKEKKSINLQITADYSHSIMNAYYWLLKRLIFMWRFLAQYICMASNNFYDSASFVSNTFCRLHLMQLDVACPCVADLLRDSEHCTVKRSGTSPVKHEFRQNSLKTCRSS